MRHCHNYRHNHHIDEDIQVENQADPMIVPSTSNVCISQSTDDHTKSPSSTIASPTLSSPSSSLASTMEGHEKNELAQLIGEQKKNSPHTKNVANLNQCSSAPAATDAALKINTATVHFIDSTTSSSTKQSPLSSQIENSAHSHDTQRSVHVIVFHTLNCTQYSFACNNLIKPIHMHIHLHFDWVAFHTHTHTERHKSASLHWYIFAWFHPNPIYPCEFFFSFEYLVV